MNNPFTLMQSRYDANLFVGRREQINTILQGISSKPPWSYLIMGARKSGKTALLDYLINSEQHGGLLRGPAVQFEYVDLLGYGEDIVHVVAGIILHLDPADIKPDDYAKVDKRLRDLEQEKKRLVLCLDNCQGHFTPKRPTTHGHLILRRWSLHAPMILATNRQLQVNARSSLLSGRTNVITLNPLNPAEARILLTKPTEQHPASGSTLSNEEQEFLLQMAGGHPYLLVLAAEYLTGRVETSLRKLISQETVRGLLLLQLVTLPTIHDHLKYLWDRVEEISDRAFLLKLAWKETIDPLAFQLETGRLMRQGLVRQELDQSSGQMTCHLSCDLLAQFVQNRAMEETAVARAAAPAETADETYDNLGSVLDRLLDYLEENPGRVLRTQELLAQVWANNASERAVHAAFHRLRERLENDGDPRARGMEKVWGQGVRYTPPKE